MTEPSTYWLPSAEELAWFGPAFVLVGTMIVVLIGTMIVGKRPNVVAGLSLLGALTAMLVNGNVARVLGGSPAGGMEPRPEGMMGTMLVADNLTVFFNFVLLLFLILVTALWVMGSASREKDAPEFMILLLGSALGMSLMVSTLNLLMIVIAIELASLPSYAIVAFDKRNRASAEAGMKYVIFGSISAAIMLYGASLLFGLFGTLDLALMAPMIVDYLQSGHNILLLSAGVFALLAGVAFKISAVPFHFWCPDVFEGAKIEVTTWLSVASKAAGLCLLMRIMYVIATAAGTAQSSALHAMTFGVGLFAALTCFVGNLSAYRQTSIKRMLAYSSIAHAGYMLMLGAITLVGDLASAAWVALLFYIAMYLFMNLGAFTATALVVWDTGSDHIENFNGLGRRSPWVAGGMTLCLFSLVGMPPLGGFVAKWWLLYALGEAGGWLWMLVIWVSLNTLFSLFYYVRIIKHMYLLDDDRPPLRVHPFGPAMVSLCAIVLLLGGTLMANTLRARAEQYADGLFDASTVRMVHEHVSSEEMVKADGLTGN